jgi:hypothetical protein
VFAAPCDFRRLKEYPTKPKPSNIIIHVDGSGTAETATWESLKPSAQVVGFLTLPQSLGSVNAAPMSQMLPELFEVFRRRLQLYSMR